MTEHRASRLRPASAEAARARRAPAPAARIRDAARTRTRILDAALSEFAGKGYAGARVSEIASKAGVNMQLIAYYFGGKAGLYRALGDRWRDIGGSIAAPAASLEDVIEGFLRAALANDSWTRLLAWEGLQPAVPEVSEEVAAEPAEQAGVDGVATRRAGYLESVVADLRERQARGELARDLDPRTVLLVFFAAVSAPVILPQVVRSIYGDDASSDTFADAYAAELRRIAERLRP